MRKIVGTYYPEWAAFRNYLPRDVPCDKLSHLIFAFARPNEKGDLIFTDIFKNKIFQEIKYVKEAHPSLKVILSIGGGKGSKYFALIAADECIRRQFIGNIMTIVNQHGFHGIDIDWEHPKNEEEAKGLALLLTELRGAGPKGFEISVAVNPLPYYVKTTKPECFIQVVDYLMLMCYDFSGPWSKETAYQSNLLTSSSKNSIETCIKCLNSKGIPNEKMVLGCPLYGRCFTNTEGLKSMFSLVGSNDDNVIEYKNIKEDHEVFDEDHGATSYYDKEKKMFITYDCPFSIENKTKYVIGNNLAGMTTWSINSDFPSGHPRCITDVISSKLNI